MLAFGVAQNILHTVCIIYCDLIVTHIMHTYIKQNFHGKITLSVKSIKCFPRLNQRETNVIILRVYILSSPKVLGHVQ